MHQSVVCHSLCHTVNLAGAVRHDMKAIDTGCSTFHTKLNSNNKCFEPRCFDKGQVGDAGHLPVEQSRSPACLAMYCPGSHC
jgi:hypothetical protein